MTMVTVTPHDDDAATQRWLHLAVHSIDPFELLNRTIGLLSSTQKTSISFHLIQLLQVAARSKLPAATAIAKAAALSESIVLAAHP